MSTFKLKLNANTCDSNGRIIILGHNVIIGGGKEPLLHPPAESTRHVDHPNGHFQFLRVLVLFLLHGQKHTHARAHVTCLGSESEDSYVLKRGGRGKREWTRVWWWGFALRGTTMASFPKAENKKWKWNVGWLFLGEKDETRPKCSVVLWYLGFGFSLNCTPSMIKYSTNYMHMWT